VFDDWSYARLRDREAREQERADLMFERRQQAVRTTRGPSLRARLARGLFALAVSVEREEIWRVVWNRLEARGRL
jgi:hypothetical protein